MTDAETAGAPGTTVAGAGDAGTTVVGADDAGTTAEAAGTVAGGAAMTTMTSVSSTNAAGTPAAQVRVGE